jgi:hypothetical protein
MKTKRPYKTRNDNARLLKDCHDTIGEAVEAWDVPDSPEGFCYAMKGLMNLKERIAVRLGLASESKRNAGESADEKRDRSALNVDVDASPPLTPQDHAER